MNSDLLIENNVFLCSCFRDSCSENVVIFAKGIFVTEFTVKKFTVCKVSFFFERSVPPNRFLRNLRNIQQQFKSGLLNVSLENKF